VRVSNVIICDDIRQEILNKFTLVGCYNDRIRVLANEQVNFPITYKLGAHIKLTKEKSEPNVKNIHVEIRDAEDVVVSVTLGMNPSTDHSRPLTLLFGGPFIFRRAGPLSVKLNIQCESGDPITLEMPLDFEIEVVNQMNFQGSSPTQPSTQV
jgi:hypothetical protein